MANREQTPIAVAETDMASLADGRMAAEDLEGLLLRLAQRPRFSLDDAERMGWDLQRIALGFEVVEKYLRMYRDGNG